MIRIFFGIKHLIKELKKYLYSDTSSKVSGLCCMYCRRYLSYYRIGMDGGFLEICFCKKTQYE